VEEYGSTFVTGGRIQIRVKGTGRGDLESGVLLEWLGLTEKTSGRKKKKVPGSQTRLKTEKNAEQKGTP